MVEGSFTLDSEIPILRTLFVAASVTLTKYTQEDVKRELRNIVTFS